jgi:Mn2+/Fe2+ NRAMP family transporter
MQGGATGDIKTGADKPVSLLKLAGPGLILVGTGVGAGDIISATVGGANYGLTLLWAVLFGALFKFVLVEGIARWQLATEQSALEGWSAHLPAWAKAYFGIYLIFWTVAVSAAMVSACGLGIENLTGRVIGRQTGAVMHTLAGFAIIRGGGFSAFEKVMKALVAIMFASIILCAALISRDPAGVMRGLLLPSIPAGGGVYVLSVLGGIGGSITLLSYNYWMREEKIVGPAYLRYVRTDLGIAYALTAAFVVAVMIIANQAFYVAGAQLTDSEAVSRMAQTLGTTLGPAGYYSYVIGFWAAVSTSLLGVWQGVPYLFADFYGIIKAYPPSMRIEITKVTGRPYRLALAFITLIPIPFALIGRPLFVIVAYTVIGSLFIPFLAATLLFLNNRIRWDSPIGRNKKSTNLFLLIILALFAIVGVLEVMELWR